METSLTQNSDLESAMGFDINQSKIGFCLWLWRNTSLFVKIVTILITIFCAFEYTLIILILTFKIIDNENMLMAIIKIGGTVNIIVMVISAATYIVLVLSSVKHSET